MSRKSSSGRWKQRQARDPFVRQAHAGGWRSRAVFKLAQIDEREHLLQRGATVLDLGAAPGGWSQYAAGKVGRGGRVVAVDLLPIEAIDGVHRIRGDFTDEKVLEQIIDALGAGKADLVLCDMAPNISGNSSVDQPRSIRLAEAVLQAAQRLLKPGGTMLIKLFQGEGVEELLQEVRVQFASVRRRKPAASRSESREIYLVAGNYRL
ncbi:MAG: RlmE family RNA methyltransferase [Gammaproteobacteria bacterium]|nr:MAG: RlmE family RNA methyltransferase [Gammaproteobacteria bacterium]